MIKIWFPIPKKTPTIVGVVPMGQAADTYGATRLGLSLDEYRKRQVIIAKCVRDAQERNWKIGDVFFPSNYNDWVSYGGVTLIGIARTPNEYGHTVWDEESPRVLRVRLNDKPASFIDCSLDFLSTQQPQPPVKEDIVC